VINRLTEAVTAVGYEWATSHVFRKTVGTLDEADLPITAIADQLGNIPRRRGAPLPEAASGQRRERRSAGGDDARCSAVTEF